MRRTSRLSGGPGGSAEDPSTQRRTPRLTGGPVGSMEDPSTQRRTPPRLSRGPLDDAEDTTGPMTMRRPIRAHRRYGGPINVTQDPSTMQRAYRRCGGPSEDAGANDSAQGSTMSSTAWPCAFSLFFFSLKNYIHVPKHIPKEGLLLGEQ